MLGISMPSSSQKYIPMNNVSFLPDIQYSENGFVFSFLRALKDIKIKKPDGYNAENEEKTIKNAKNVSESQLPTT